MRRALPLFLLLLLAGSPASGLDSPEAYRLRSEVAAALRRIDMAPGDLVVRDLLALSRNEARWRSSGVWAGTWPMPRAREPMRPSLVDRALRRPLDALSLGVDLAIATPPRELRFLLGPFRSSSTPIRPESLEELLTLVRDGLGHLDRRARKEIPAGDDAVRMRTWTADSIEVPDLADARKAFDRYAAVDYRSLALDARAFAEMLLRIDISGISDWPVKEARTLPGEPGPIVVGTPGPDVHRARAWIVIDPGGDDVYLNNAGSAAGSFRTALSLDFGGNDRYSSHQGEAQGAGIFGIGVLVDRSGDDTYDARTHAQGAALCGVGLLFDGGGHDRFTADRFAQGAAAFGYALLRNNGQEGDLYHVEQQGQGFGRMAGHGLIEDGGGDDRYLAGTKYRSEMYSQWTGGRPVHWSFAQGCGLGFYGRYSGPDGKLVTREMFPGGVGLLLDHAGHDTYIGSMYAQGTAYFYGLGMLIDRGGNDYYRATWYGQGAAPHYAAGILVDASGDDVYEGMNQVQGNGRDFSTAVFVDLEGNDRYFAEDRVQGCGDLADGYGIFIDAAGNDTYGSRRKSARGYATERRPERQPRPDRPYHDVGVFLDLGGRDVYRGPALGANRTVWIQRSTRRGVGVDR